MLAITPSGKMFTYRSTLLKEMRCKQWNGLTKETTAYIYISYSILLTKVGQIDCILVHTHTDIKLRNDKRQNKMQKLGFHR